MKTKLPGMLRKYRYYDVDVDIYLTQLLRKKKKK